jgi:hypothetical protein
MSLILGIDPGKGGAVVGLQALRVFEESRFSFGIIVANTSDWLLRTGKGAKREYDEDAMAKWLAALGPIELAVLEAQAARPGQGVVSMVSIGVGFGLWRGLLAGRGIPRVLVHPRTWTAAMLKGAPGEGKDRAVAVVRRLLPDLDLGVKSKAQARADAACLALYGLRQLAPLEAQEYTSSTGGRLP